MLTLAELKELAAAWGFPQMGRLGTRNGRRFLRLYRSDEYTFVLVAPPSWNTRMILNCLLEDATRPDGRQLASYDVDGDWPTDVVIHMD